MATVAIYSLKGGVGKTTLSVNLAWCAATLSARRTLLWDLDPQGGSTYLLRVRPKVKGGARKLVRGKSDLAASIKGTDHEHLDLLPADFSYRHMDLALDAAKRPTRRIGRLLAPFAPFVTDWLHRQLVGDSVHLADYVRADAGVGARHHALEDAMTAVQRLATLGRAAREEVGIPVRQALGAMVAVVPFHEDGGAAGSVRRLVRELEPLLAAELNVKSIRWAESGDALVTLDAHEVYAALGFHPPIRPQTYMERLAPDAAALLRAVP